MGKGIFSIFSGGKVKNESKLMFNLCCKRAASIGHTEFLRTNGKMSLEAVYKTDMLNFLVYLMYADGCLCKEEIKFVNSLFGINWIDKQYSEYANKWDLKTEHLRDRPPMSLEAFVRSNVGGETGEISDEYYDLLTLYVTTFNYIGNDLIACNDEISKCEVDSLSAYMMSIRQAIEDAKQKHEDYKPTIAFKPGSRVKQEESVYEDKVERLSDREGADEAVREDMLSKQGVGFTPYSDKDNHRKLSLSLQNETDTNASSDESNDNGYDFMREPLEGYKKKRHEMPEKQLEERSEKETEFIGQYVAPEETNLEQLMSELNGLTGMEDVKKEVNNLVNLLKICRIRQQKGLKTPPTTNHLVFLGNPGTGKTTVARILAKIYHNLGVLSKGQLVEVDRSGLIAGYMGQTGIKVMEVVESAKGGVLFIDEAYALSSNKSEGDFGQEAIDILNKAMEDFKDDLIVIAAGYHKEMQTFLDANPGLRSRFNRTIEFKNYNADDLIEIMTNRAKKLDYVIEDEALEYIRNYFEEVLEYPPKNFGNARSVRNYLDNAINRQANRIVKETQLDEEALVRITIEDVEGLVLE